MKLCTLFDICLFMALLERHKNRLQQSQNWSLSQDSFFLYCAHDIFTGSVSGALAKVAVTAPHSLVFMFAQIIKIAGVVSVLCLLSKLVKNIAPVPYYILSRGR